MHIAIIYLSEERDRSNRRSKESIAIIYLLEEGTGITGGDQKKILLLFIYQRKGPV